MQHVGLQPRLVEICTKYTYCAAKNLKNMKNTYENARQ